MWTQEFKYVLWSIGPTQCMPKLGTISWSRTITYVTIACPTLIPCDVYKTNNLTYPMWFLFCYVTWYYILKHNPNLLQSPFAWRHECKYVLWLMGAIQFMPKEGIISPPPSLYIQWARPILHIVLASHYRWLVDAYNRTKVICLREPKFDSYMACPRSSTHELYHSLLAIYNISRDLWMLIMYHSDQI